MLLWSLHGEHEEGSGLSRSKQSGGSGGGGGKSKNVMLHDCIHTCFQNPKYPKLTKRHES
jgi:hypothetical protein